MRVNSGWKVRGWRVVLAVSFLAGLLLLPGIAYAQDEIECGDAPSSYNSFPDAASPTGSLLMTAYPKGGPLGIQANFPVVVLPYAPLPRRLWDVPCACAGRSLFIHGAAAAAWA